MEIETLLLIGTFFFVLCPYKYIFLKAKSSSKRERFFKTRFLPTTFTLKTMLAVNCSRLRENRYVGR